MEDDQQINDVQPEVKTADVKPEAEETKPEAPAAAAPVAEVSKLDLSKLFTGSKPPTEGRPQGSPRREDRPPREGRGGPRREGRPEGKGGEAKGGETRGGEARGERRGPERGERGGRPGGGRPFEMAPDIELEKLISDSLYLDNQAHAVVARMRDMDSGTKSQLRRLYNAVRRAVRAPESERQHHFVMLRARLAYTIARHSLRSLDALERLLLQVTRRNEARGYERFKDLFEAIVAYNE
jgi:CRISPR type III-A-associated protein Csm2